MKEELYSKRSFILRVRKKRVRLQEAILEKSSTIQGIIIIWDKEDVILLC